MTNTDGADTTFTSIKRETVRSTADLEGTTIVFIRRDAGPDYDEVHLRTGTGLEVFLGYSNEQVRLVEMVMPAHVEHKLRTIAAGY